MTDRPPQPAHPDVETLAAFAEGALDGVARQRVVEHVADCPDCYELVAGTARFLDEEARGPAADPAPSPTVLRPAPGRWRSRLAVAATLAAAAAAALLLIGRPTGWWQGPAPAPGPALGELAAALPAAPSLVTTLAADWDAHGWPVSRGTVPTSTEGPQRSFRLGVRVLELDLALRGGDHELARRLTYRIDPLLGSGSAGAPLRGLYTGEQGIRGRLAAGVPPEALLPVSRQGDLLLDGGAAAVDPFWYGFGKWAAAAELAAGAGETSFLAAPLTRRFLAGTDGRDLPAGVADPLAALRRELETPAAERRPARLRADLAALVRRAGGG